MSLLGSRSGILGSIAFATAIGCGNLLAADASSVQDGSQYRLRLAEPQSYRLRSGPEYRLPGPEPEPPRIAEVPSIPVPPAGREFADLIERAALDHGVDAALLHAVITVESGYNPRAVSPRGAIGLMQLMPDTARRYGVSDPRAPAANLRAGAAYLRDLLALFENDLQLALAAYNAGEGAVQRRGGRIPPYPETRQYVPRVMSTYRQLKPMPAPLWNAERPAGPYRLRPRPSTLIEG